MTRTHTRYFTEDNEAIVALREAIDAVRRDWESRKPFMDKGTYEAGHARLVPLEVGLFLLTERVPE